jgi:glycerophosphoryl diester phosphodiesterase
MPFNGYTQEQYARDMLNMFVDKGIDPNRVWPQSFLPADIYQWLEEYPDTFGPQAVYLDEDGDTPETFVTAVARLPALKAKGVNIIAPPFNYLITVGGENNDTLIPSAYATAAKAAGLSIISWSFERSGPLADVYANENYYFSTFASAISYDGQAFDVLNVLANEIGIIGMFSDWSSTVGYFANCFGIKGPIGEDY